MALNSFLSSLGTGASNVLQALAPREELQGYAPVELQQMQANVPQVQAQAPAQPQAPTRPRRSLLQTVGQVSDVLASVGGATPMYQSGLDAQQAREMGVSQLDDQRLGMAMQGAQALMQSGANEEQLLSAVPQLLQQAGVDEARAAGIIEQIQQNPQLIRGIMGASGVESTDPKFGMNVQYARDGQGNVRAYVMNGVTGRPQFLDLEGADPMLPLQAVNAGDRTVFGDRLTGNSQGVAIEHGVRPDTEANNAARFDIAQLNAANQRAMQSARLEAQDAIARLRAGGSSDENTGKTENVFNMIDELESIYRGMHERGENVSAGNPAILNVWNRAMTSGVGQLVGGALGSQRQTAIDKVESIRPSLLMAVAQATGLKSTQLNSNQELQTYLKTLSNPAASYEANIFALGGVRNFIASNAGTEVPAPARRPASSGRPTNVRATPRSNAAPRQGAGPTVVNW
jgi:hypothetical protein